MSRHAVTSRPSRAASASAPPARRRIWLISAGLLAALAVTAALIVNASGSTGSAPRARTGSPTPAAQPAAKSVDFRTLPPGSPLPSGAECARLVRATTSTEIRPANRPDNHRTGQRVGPALFPKGDSPQAAALAPLITGGFTGTTQQILEWAACKWGISQDVVFAQAAAESSWEQTHLGDWGTDAASCPPGYGIGANGLPGQCPESVGILQTKYDIWAPAWPGIGDSTAMNVDVTYAIWRSCFDGYEIWLRNSATAAHPYRPGDLWGCIGRWFAGAWYTSGADRYIQRVQSLARQRIWEQPGFIRAIQGG